MKALKALIKPLEAPQRSVKIKISVNFFSLSGIGAGKDNSKIHKKHWIQRGENFAIESISINFANLDQIHENKFR